MFLVLLCFTLYPKYVCTGLYLNYIKYPPSKFYVFDMVTSKFTLVWSYANLCAKMNVL